MSSLSSSVKITSQQFFLCLTHSNLWHFPRIFSLFFNLGQQLVLHTVFLETPFLLLLIHTLCIETGLLLWVAFNYFVLLPVA